MVVVVVVGVFVFLVLVVRVGDVDESSEWWLVMVVMVRICGSYCGGGIFVFIFMIKI